MTATERGLEERAKRGGDGDVVAPVDGRALGTRSFAAQRSTTSTTPLWNVA